MIDIKNKLLKGDGQQGVSMESDSPEGILENRIEKARKGREGKWLLFDVFITIVVVIIVFKFVFGTSSVLGNSMFPNYKDGDRVVYLRLTNSFNKGDVIIFHAKDENDLIKRVIATEGDTVDIDEEEGAVLVNDRVVEENYIFVPTTRTDSKMKFPQKVSSGNVFVLGDNRTVSKDSRHTSIGQVPIENIAGRVVLQGRLIK